MSLIKRWRASPKNLVGPDFRKAPWVEINLSGGRVRFKNPPITSMVPYQPPPDAVDIYCAELSERPVHDFEQASGMKLLSTGWDFYSGLSADSAVGGLMVDIMLFRLQSDAARQGSLFDMARLEYYSLDNVERVVGWLNRNLLETLDHDDPMALERLPYEYPKSAEDLVVKEIGGRPWISYHRGEPGYPGRYIHRTAVGSEHYLDVVMEPDCYQDDYYSPAHNMQEVVPKTIDEFMQHMHVQLSPEAQRLHDEINRPGAG